MGSTPKNEVNRIAIVHPWMPQYRDLFFYRLGKALEDRGISLDVYYGEPNPTWGERGDSVNPEHSQSVRTFFIKVGSRYMQYKSLPLRKFKKYKLVIVEDALHNVETYLLWLIGARIAYWGHGRSYTERAPWPLKLLKTLLVRSSAWFFSYTSGGAKTIIEGGMNPDRVSVLNNSLDISPLLELSQKITDSELSAFRLKIGAGDGQIGLFLGALDKSKKLELLFASCDEVFKKNPAFRLVVIGDGPERPFVEAATSVRTYVTFLGKSFEKSKVLALMSADFLLVPGRVGLVTIESFNFEVPIITTADPFHAPEFEYLIPNQNSELSDESSHAYAASILKVISDTDYLRTLKEGCRAAAETYTVGHMVEVFAESVVAGIGRSV